MRILPLVGIASAAVLTLACAGVGADDTTTAGPGSTAAAGSSAGAAPASDGTRAITFEVTGDGVDKATSITYGVGGNSSQANSAALPWTKDTTSTGAFLVVSLVAQSGGESGSISCKVTVDGKVLVENTSEGAYAVVTCAESA